MELTENEVKSIIDVKNEISVVLAGRVAEREILNEIQKLNALDQMYLGEDS